MYQPNKEWALKKINRMEMVTKHINTSEFNFI
jgi:hypothetical protein